MDVLITHRNQEQTIRRSLDSLLGQLGPSDRLVIVDSNSTDGSFDVIEKYYVSESVVMDFESGLSRGEGRQSAFELGSDEIVAAHIDLDVTYSPCLSTVAERYRDLRAEREPGLLLFHGGMIADRSVVDAAGGWRDLQVHEDKDLWVRIAEQFPVYYLPVSIVEEHDNYEWQSVRYRLRRLYSNYRDALRLGIPRARLERSIRNHLPLTERWRDRRLLSLAARNARDGAFDTLERYSFDPEAHLLRELPFGSLVESGALPLSRLDVPPELAEYRSTSAYPGMTSYASDGGGGSAGGHSR
ncbi:glycosyltransferase family A protein [Haloplanus halophilus]|uniref:glycosyltransferase family A protein n=1 Tax=Haloplanus halophilus TaxID=2949993 RepID=UPI0020412F4F|nr:glycosyltransferase family A protein [Haloplanus sp. GDY1]